MPHGPFLQTTFGLMLSGFILTTVFGSGLAFIWQTISWRRQTRLELFRRRYEEGIELLNQLSSLIDRRLYALLKVKWALENSNQEEIEAKEIPYYSIVQEWNEHLRMNRGKIRLLIGEKYALAFLDYDDEDKELPNSLHFKFVKTHVAFRAVLKHEAPVESLSEATQNLHRYCNHFLEELSAEFASRADDLSLLKLVNVAPRKVSKFGKPSTVMSPTTRVRTTGNINEPEPIQSINHISN